ncbi:helix-turn-helix domain-containing protein [Actinomadura rugatobispora]|uniref:Helix-turn-helix domain-containing protein n=1 Tax=Actinomadura rugatobispora TaxID=1994 RepID=A0ABW1A3V7_9ACTN|nr:helix-turn-helix domain-containing protein [Actinomadura rugatobispora]
MAHQHVDIIDSPSPDTGHDAAPDSDADGRVTVGALLAEPLLRGGLVAGAAGLDRRVSWCLPLSETRRYAEGQVGSADLGGIAVHLPATMLAAADEAIALIHELSRRGAAALLAWQQPGTRCDLKAAARAADRARVPLLALREEADYRAVSRLVGQKALAQTSHVLEYGARVHRALADVLAQGSGIPAMAHAIANLSRCPVLILDEDGERLAWEQPPGGTATDPDGIAAALPAVPEPAAEPGPVPGGPEAPGAAGGAAGGHPVELDLRPSPDGDPVRALLAPIIVGGEPYGRLVLLERAFPPDDHDLAQHRVIAEHGATLTGSEMLRQRSVRAAEERARGDFVEALVHGRFADPHELGARARHHGFDVSGTFAVHVVSASALLPVGRDYLRHKLTATRIAQAMEPDGSTLTASIGSTIVVIRQLAACGDPLRERQEAGRFAQRLRRRLLPSLGEDLRVTHGRPGKGAAGVATGYYEARLAMGLSWHTDADRVCGYDDLRVFAALKEVAGSAEGQAFAAETLAPLRQAGGGDLEPIVLAYIRNAGNLNAAARSLTLHRNTMLYKLDRASRALRMDIRTADAQFMFWLAHHIETLSSVTQTLADELTPPAERR